MFPNNFPDSGNMKDLDDYLSMMTKVIDQNDRDRIDWRNAPDLEVYDAEMQQREDFIASLEESDHLKELQQYSQGHLIGQVDVGRRITILRQLIDHHGRSDIWSRMPALEDFVSGKRKLPSQADGKIEDPDAFDSAQSGIEGVWNPLGQLGAGAYGKATLWVKVDASSRPTDKVVIESVDLSKRAGHWNGSEYWRGDNDKRLPMEYDLPKSLNDLPESLNIVDTRGYAVYEQRRVYNIYLGYCPRGSLADLVKRYHKTNNLVAEDGVPLNARIPVRVMWSIFEALASAVCLMHNGHLPGDASPPENTFTAFYHRDIKPENVFLVDPDQVFWPQVPVAKLGDFGLCVLAVSTDKNGTDGWKAPEMEDYDTSETSFDEQEDWNIHFPSPISDIWSLGSRVMLCLMNLEDPETVPPWRMHEHSESFPRPYTNPFDKFSGLYTKSYYHGVEEYYPLEMRGLVEQCLNMYPDKRIDASDLWEGVHTHVATGKGLRGGPLRMMPRGSLGHELLLAEHIQPMDCINDQLTA